MIGSTLMPLYNLTISAADGNAPQVALMVYSAASSQGWDQATLQSALQSSFTPGMNSGEFVSPGFTFPTLSFSLPANEAGTLFTFDQAQLVPEPSSVILMCSATMWISLNLFRKPKTTRAAPRELRN
jgi:hypothetical protein